MNSKKHITNSSSIVPAQKKRASTGQPKRWFFCAFASQIIAQKTQHFVCRLAKRYIASKYRVKQ